MQARAPRWGTGTAAHAIGKASSDRAHQLWGVVREAFLSNASTSAVTAFLELGQVKWDPIRTFCVDNCALYVNQKRQAAMDAIARGETRLNDAKASVRQQGDLEWYTVVRHVITLFFMY